MWNISWDFLDIYGKNLSKVMQTCCNNFRKYSSESAIVIKMSVRVVKKKGRGGERTSIQTSIGLTVILSAESSQAISASARSSC